MSFFIKHSCIPVPTPHLWHRIKRDEPKIADTVFHYFCSFLLYSEYKKFFFSYTFKLIPAYARRLTSFSSNRTLRDEHVPLNILSKRRHRDAQQLHRSLGVYQPALWDGLLRGLQNEIAHYRSHGFI